MTEIDSSLDVIDSKIDVIDSKTDVIDSKLDAHDSHLDVVEANILSAIDEAEENILSAVDEVESKAEVISSQAEVIDSKLDSHDSHLDAVEANILSAIDEAEENILSAVDEVESKAEVISSQAEIIDSKLDAHDSHLAAVEESILSAVDDAETKVLSGVDEAEENILSAVDEVESKAEVISSVVDIIEERTRCCDGITAFPLDLAAPAPVIITTSGKYCLRGNVPQVTIDAPNVCLDLNCHSVTPNGITITAGQSNITLRNGTVAGGANGILINNDSHDIIMEHLMIEDATTAGISALLNSAAILIKDVCIKRCDIGISTNGTTNVLVADCSILGGRIGINPTNCNNTEVYHAYIAGCSSQGLTNNQAHGTVITDTVIIGCTGVGMQIINSNKFFMKDSTISKNYDGIFVNVSDQCNIIDCKINSNEGNADNFGIKLQAATHCNIEKCTVDYNQASGIVHGIWLQGTGNNENTIRNNAVMHNVSTGAGTSYGIRNQSLLTTSNKFFGNYVCGHDQNYAGVGFIGDLHNASPHHNVECGVTGIDHFASLESKLDVLTALLVLHDSKFDAHDTKLEQCCSKIDVNFTKVLSAIDEVESKAEVISDQIEDLAESQVSCCEILGTVNSKVDIIDTEVGALAGDQESCCEILGMVNSKVDALAEAQESCCESLIELITNLG